MSKEVRLSNRKLNRYLWAYAFIAPTVILVIILNIWPIAQTFYFSLNKIKGLGGAQWVGLDNYKQALGDSTMWQSLWNTFKYVIGTVPLGVFLSLLTAVFLNANIKYKSIFRTLIFLPVISAPVAVAMVWRWLYNQEYGLINYLLSFIGIKGPDWIADTNYALISVIIIGIWSMIGFNMVILLAGLQEIPKSYYEAVEIDGAGVFAKFFHITLPLVTPVLFFVAITTMISSLQVFDIIFMMINERNPAFQSVQSIVYMYYNQTFIVNDKGYGSTIAMIILLIVLLLTYIQLKLQKKWVHY